MSLHMVAFSRSGAYIAISGVPMGSLVTVADHTMNDAFEPIPADGSWLFPAGSGNQPNGRFSPEYSELPIGKVAPGADLGEYLGQPNLRVLPYKMVSFLQASACWGWLSLIGVRQLTGESMPHRGVAADDPRNAGIIEYFRPKPVTMESQHDR